MIGESDVVRIAHNSFARPEVFVSDDEKYSKKGTKTEEAYHFIAYVPFEGNVYELDGLKAGPVFLGSIPEDDSASTWTTVAGPAIEARMGRYSATETHFALMSGRCIPYSLYLLCLYTDTLSVYPNSIQYVRSR